MEATNKELRELAHIMRITGISKQMALVIITHLQTSKQVKMMQDYIMEYKETITDHQAFQMVIIYIRRWTMNQEKMYIIKNIFTKKGDVINE